MNRNTFVRMRSCMLSRVRFRVLSRALSGALSALLLLAMPSCDHKELCTDHFHNTDLRVVFDWENAPEASPESMRLYLFPMSGGKPLVYEFADFRGGYADVPAGRYRAICVNSDNETVLYRNTDSYDTFEVYASDGTLNVRSSSVPRAEGTETERIAQSLDPLYTDHLDAFTLEALTDGQTLTLRPNFSLQRCRIKVSGVTNLQYLSPDGLTGAISGMSGGLLVGKGVTTTESVTVPFAMDSDGESTLTADFLIFGGTPKEGTEETHKMTVYAVMADGSKNYYTFDVSPSDGEEGDAITVHIESLPLPKPIVNGGGFHPAVDGWKNIEVDVPM